MGLEAHSERLCRDRQCPLHGYQHADYKKSRSVSGQAVIVTYSESGFHVVFGDRAVATHHVQ